jgi:threonine synthase
MSAFKVLKCRECNTEYPLEKRYVCEKCFGPLDVIYRYEEIKWTKDLFLGREKNFWRYFELLPMLDKKNIVNLWAGFTPLHRAERLAESLGLKNLYIKNDTVNPTFSFKDRPAGVGISKAIEFGLSSVGCASTGNLAAATAAHAARSALDCYVFIPKGIEREKVAQALAYGPKIIEVEGTYDDANRLAAQAADIHNIGIVNINLRTYYVEGSKTLAFEIAEQLGWNLPDHVIIPVGSGALLHATCKGFEELYKTGIIKWNNPKITAAQPQGSSPVVNAFKKGLTTVEPIENPQTIAKSLAIGEPGDGVYALKKVLEYNGYAEDASDEEIIKGVKLLAKTEGIFSEPAGGVTIAVLKKLIDNGQITRDEKVVLLVTGSGLKAPEVVTEQFERLYHVKPEIEALTPLITR